ncbi:hybrid sensor histidine kinase/response regulator [Thiothrix nivea]|uniref:hybrid sensor histidine kinase/response regulator n=1 Tax=Thiothrix nivea TaxID=1031 RepID=UPI0009DA2310|nr:hybrid sensor histidine kinase/response regulator [Thiothrix nivea]
MARQEPLVLPASLGTESLSASPYAEFLEDSTRQLSLEQVASPLYANQFQTNTSGNALNFGRTRSAWWVRFSVVNTSPSSQQWYMLLDALLGDEFALYILPEKADVRQESTTVTAQYIQSLEGFRRRAWEMHLPSGETFQVYMRATNGDSILRLPVEFLSADAMLMRSNHNHLLLGGLYVAMLLLATYQLLMFVSLRESSYLFLATHILAMFATIHRTNPVFSHLAFLSDTGSYFFTAPTFIAIASFLLFSRQILDLPRNNPRLSRVYLLSAVVCMAMIAITGAIPGGSVLPSWLGLGLYLLEIPVSLWLAFRGNRIALYFGVLHVIALFTQAWNWWHVVFSAQVWDTSQDLYMGLISLQLIFPVSWLQALRVRFLREQVKQAAAEHKAKDEFLAVMSHELRTPLHAIVGLTGLLRLGSQAEKQGEYLERLHTAAQHQLHLVGNILDMAKAASHTLQLDCRPFRLDLAIHSLLAMVQQAACQKGLELVLQLDGLEGVTLLGDRLRLTQVLMNLLGNAVKYTRYGYVTLTVVVSPVSDGRCRVRFVVADTGIGIPPDKLGHLFEPFSQVAGQAVLQQGGVGLGLAISRQLVEAMGGALTVASQPGEGSEFACEITFAVPEAGLETASEAMTQHALPPGLRVLLVDDSEINRFVGVEMLHNLGVEDVELAPDGEAAILQLQQQDFDVVLLDISMPGIDGFAVTRWVRRHGRDPQVPVVALSAHVLPGVQQEGMAAGMDAFLGKPFEYAELVVAILGVLSGGRGDNEGR